MNGAGSGEWQVMTMIVLLMIATPITCVVMLLQFIRRPRRPLISTSDLEQPAPNFELASRLTVWAGLTALLGVFWLFFFYYVAPGIGHASPRDVAPIGMIPAYVLLLCLYVFGCKRLKGWVERQEAAPAPSDSSGSSDTPVV